MATPQILNPARARVYFNDVGGTAPTTSTEALDPTWINVGLTTPDSLSFTTEPEFQPINSHQSDYEVARIQTGDSAAVSVDLQEWNTDNLVFVFGGGTVTEPDETTSPGEYKFTPPKLGARQEKSAIVEVINGTKTYRWVFPRVMQIEGVSSEFQKGQEARLPLRLAVLGDDASDPWYMLTNDANFQVTP